MEADRLSGRAYRRFEDLAVGAPGRGEAHRRYLALDAAYLGAVEAERAALAREGRHDPFGAPEARPPGWHRLPLKLGKLLPETRAEESPAGNAGE